MFDSMDIRDEIELAADNLRASMPDEIKRLARLCCSDLRGGPVYLDESGESVSCFDDGATPFNFSAACDAIAEWAESVSDIEIETAYCEETDESQFESVDGTREAILRELFGADLAPYI